MLPKALRETAQTLRHLPQIGPRQALRMALFLFRNENDRKELVNQLAQLGSAATLCSLCFRISEKTPCDICVARDRDASILAVVEEDTDLEQLEGTHAFSGRYFVLGGRFNEHRGGPEDQGLRVAELKKRLMREKPSLHEVVLAMNPTVEGDALALTLMRELRDLGVPITRLGRGLPVGGEIEYADEETLKSALEHRG